MEIVVYYGIKLNLKSNNKKNKVMQNIMITLMISNLMDSFKTSYPIIDGEEMLIVSKEVFGDSEEHEINFHYGNGMAISEDGQYVLLYPKIADLTEDDKESICKYDGIAEPRNYTYRDIALKFGIVNKNCFIF